MSDEIRVKDWISWKDSGHLKGSFGGMGGFIQHGMRWKDYLGDQDPKGLVYAEALRKEIVEKKIKTNGYEHQSENCNGVPVFSDNTCARFSMRAWGDLLAAIWSEEENKDYCYMDFYC